MAFSGTYALLVLIEFDEEVWFIVFVDGIRWFILGWLLELVLGILLPVLADDMLLSELVIGKPVLVVGILLPELVVGILLSELVVGILLPAFVFGKPVLLLFVLSWIPGVKVLFPMPPELFVVASP